MTKSRCVAPPRRRGRRPTQKQIETLDTIWERATAKG